MPERLEEQPQEGNIVRIDRWDERFKAVSSLAEKHGLNLSEMVFDTRNNTFNITLIAPPGLEGKERLRQFEEELREEPPRGFPEGASFRIATEVALPLSPFERPQTAEVSETTFGASLRGSRREQFSRLTLLPRGTTVYLPSVTEISGEGVLEVEPPEFSSLAGTTLAGGVELGAFPEYFQRRTYEYALASARARLGEGGVVDVSLPDVEAAKREALQGFLQDLTGAVVVEVGGEQKRLIDLASQESLTDEEKAALKKLLFGRSRVADENFNSYWNALKAAVEDPSKIDDFLTALQNYTGSGLLKDLSQSYTKMTDESNVDQLLSQIHTISKLVYFNSEQGVMVAKLVDSPDREVYVMITMNQETGAYQVSPVSEVETAEEGGKKIKYFKTGAGATIRVDESSDLVDGFVYLRADVALKWVEGIAYGEYGGEAGAGAKLKLGPVSPFGAIIASSRSVVEPSSSLIIMQQDGSLARGTFRRVSLNELEVMLGFDLKIVKSLNMATQVFYAAQSVGGISPTTRRRGISTEFRYRIGEDLILSLGGLYAIENTPIGRITEKGVTIGVTRIPIGKGYLEVGGQLHRVEDPIAGPYWRGNFVLGFRF